MNETNSKKIFAFITFLIVITSYQNCAPPPPPTSNTNSTNSMYVAPSGLPAINYFREQRPASLCGKDGWAFLQRNYISKNCSGCHYKGSIIAPYAFGDQDINIAYADAVLISKPKWDSFTTHNGFCYPNCNILPEGEVYHGIMEWTDHHTCQ